ncbi:PREDICTED: uncharacterized protein K02A2.6-like [Wasmannia auropunctata]|uniref:uncharacterized protein K02A2.6-like n=1 Tax=Wasmannia auropunctata TaxID=64793 RepID=UPI0005EEE513|nr:PREDICTED: uncharacterized protein K02A2.6-like [Wasmannia auropunctata]
MDRMLKGIPKTGSFVDDTIITGKDDQDHLQNLKMVLQRMREWNFRLSRKKSNLLQPSVKFLGQILCAEGICTDLDKIKSIMSMREPKDINELKSFLGLTRDGVKWNWNDKCRKSFNGIKKAVSSAPILAHYQQTVPVGIACDASSVGVGVVLFHRYEDGSERPIAFASKTLSAAERNYSQVEKEALSIVFGIKRFIQYLYGCRFILVTDHNPLLAIFGPNRELPSLAATRLHRWAIFLSSFLYDIEYRNTHRHGNADALSRLPLEDSKPVDVEIEEEIKAIAVEHPITSNLVRQKTNRDPTLSSVTRFIRKGWPDKQSQLSDNLKPYFIHRDEFTVEQGIVMWGIRVVIPESLRDQVLKQLHETHSGIVRMKALARSYVWWPGMDNDIGTLAKSCVSCAVNRDNPPTAPLHPWSFPEKAWQRLHVDLAGPFLNNMWLIMVDAYSKWPEVYKLGKDSSSAQVIQCIRESISRYGIPDTIVSDNGPQFVSKEFEEFCKKNGIRHTTSSAYHPRSNGEAERFVRTFKNNMKSSKNAQKDNLELCNFLFNYRITVHATTGVAPSELMMRRQLKCHLDLLHPDVDSTVKINQEKQRHQFNKKVPVREFSPGDKVWVRTFGKHDPKWNLGTIIRSVGPVSYIVQVDSRTLKRHVDHIISASVQKPLETNSNDIIINPEELSNSTEPEIVEEQSPEPGSSSSAEPTKSSRPKRNTHPPDRLEYSSLGKQNLKGGGKCSIE